MQIEKQNSISQDWTEVKESHPQADFIQEMVEAGEMYDVTFITNRPRWKTLSNEKKIATCTHQTGIPSYRKMPNGEVIPVPLYCHLCEKCYQDTIDEVKDKILFAARSAKMKKPNGQWRMKLVDENTEAQSLKKRIKRNQHGMHMELTSKYDGKSEMWSFIEDEPGKNMDRIYGKIADPRDINFEVLYERNRATGKKISMGKALRRLKKDEKENTKRILVPQVVPESKSQQVQVMKVMEETNYLEEAESASDVINMFLMQFKYVMRELEKADIKVRTVKYSYIHMTDEELLDGWNTNVKYWMSIINAKTKNLAQKVDIMSRLIIPEKEKSETVVN